MTVRHRTRNLAAILLAAAAAAVLYSHCQPVPVGANLDGIGVDLDKVTADVQAPRPTPAESRRPPVRNNTAGETEAPAGTIADRTALLVNLLLLEEGIERSRNLPGYTATFCRRERVDGAMKPHQVMQLKLRHKPFSLYLKWLAGDKGRELLYVDGENDGKMLVKVGGVKGRLLPPIKLDLDGSIARREARHPITDVGIVRLAERVVRRRRAELHSNHNTRCQMFDNQRAADRDCCCFVLEYESPQTSPVYRKSVLFVDKEWLLPIYIKNYTWPETDSATAAANLDDATLIEHYSYSNIRVDAQLADRDFDRGNENYQFRR